MKILALNAILFFINIFIMIHSSELLNEAKQYYYHSWLNNNQVNKTYQAISNENDLLKDITKELNEIMELIDDKN